MQDIEAVDPQYFKNLEWMLENDITDILDFTFTEEVAVRITCFFCSSPPLSLNISSMDALSCDAIEAKPPWLPRHEALSDRNQSGRAP